METPYADILYTNIVPSDEVIGGIQRLVAAPLRMIQGPTNQIDGLQTSLDQLTRQWDELIRQRDGLTEFFESHLALASKPRQLPPPPPPPRLEEIFTASLPSN
ncbi:hypothetical protein DFH08DRAFT_1035938 [Mycena albidolilacea]|uniref:Uncharacterized protein n=1 Tax=Mycena albidolilacea TaxID=1033008 RepID=A0AAD7EER2_9AGAR|nr:hypothetical protein DFH08DRAFT_1035938 [Mycena albidolilacea]